MNAVPGHFPRSVRLDFAPLVLLAAGDWFEILAALIFFLITGVAQWLQKRSRQRQSLPPEPLEDMTREPWPSPSEATPPPRRSDRRSPSPEEFDLEAQLRRLLNPGLPIEPPPLPPQLPPRIPVRTVEPEESRSLEDTEVPFPRLASLEAAEAAYQRGAGVESKVASRLTSAGHLAMASAAVQSAADLSETVSARLRDVLGRAAAPAPTTAHLLGSTVSPRARSLAEALRQPASIRQALLTATLLGPPKALEQESLR